MGERIKTETKAPESKSGTFSSNRQQKNDSFRLENPWVDPVRVLQRTIGNQAVQRLSASRSLEYRPSLLEPPCACLVFVHNNEQNARRAAETLHAGCRYNLAVIGPGSSRTIQIPGSGSIDPNELFPADIQTECTSDESACRDYIETHDNLRAAQMQFFLSIKDCAQGFTLPVVALHNNSISDTEQYRQAVPAMGHRIAVLMEDTNRETPSGRGSRDDLRSRLEGLREETGQQLTGIMDARGTTNIFRWCNLPEISRCHIGDPFRPDLVIWVTNPSDFETLSRSNVNVGLQEGSTTGSESDTDLSTLFTRLGSDAHFINIETPVSPQDETTRTDSMIFILENLQRLGLNCCETERREGTGTEGEPVQRKPLSEESVCASHDIDQDISGMQGAGRPLPDSTRKYFEPRFGVDFSEVRIHSDQQADHVSRGINARAFTYGRDLFFQSGEYDTLSRVGKQLLAHELTHVVQQGAAKQSKPMPAVNSMPGTVCRSRTSFMAGPGGEDIHVDSSQGMRIARETAPVSPNASQAGPAALRAASEMENLRSQNILLDFWNGDCRDNDKVNLFDNLDPRAEGPGSWAGHIGETKPGFAVIGGYHCQGGEGGEVLTHNFNTDQTVLYSVCARIVSQAFHTAGMPIPETNGTGDIIRWFRARNPLRRFWLWSDFFGPCLPGDFICSFGGGGGHSGMVVEAGSGIPTVIHLAGTSEHIKRGVYNPERLSDMTREPWPNANRPIFGIGRYLG